MLDSGGTVEPRNVEHRGYSGAKKCWTLGVWWNHEMLNTGGTVEL